MIQAKGSGGAKGGGRGASGRGKGGGGGVTRAYDPNWVFESRQVSVTKPHGAKDGIEVVFGGAILERLLPPFFCCGLKWFSKRERE